MAKGEVMIQADVELFVNIVFYGMVVVALHDLLQIRRWSNMNTDTAVAPKPEAKTNKGDTMEILITGGAGFIGHHLVEQILKTTDHNITIIDRLTYASSGFDRLKDIHAYEHPRIKFFAHDFTHPIEGSLFEEIGKQDYIVHMGAESHVDRSIKDPARFVQSNVVGTMQMLEFARKMKAEHGLKKFLYFSTDEVFGPAPGKVSFGEWDRYNSTNPYAASKAGGEELALAYSNTYKLPMIITHCMNVFGERQHKEKFIPIVINKIRKGQILEIHCKDDVPASRSWIHARNASAAVMFLLEDTQETIRDKFNIIGVEKDTLEIAKIISKVMGQPLRYRLVNHYKDRPGHDPRYMLKGGKLQKQGWKCPVDFEESLEKMVKWTLDNERWLEW